MWPRFGIKIGNSNVCIAVAKDDGKIEVIANKQGDRVSPACLISEGGELEVGMTAKQKMSSKLTSAVVNNLLLLPKNLTEEQIENLLKYITCKFNKITSKYDLISQGQETAHLSITPYKVCVEFFKASFELARQYHVTKIHPTLVLSVPDYYPHDGWEDIANAAEEAGFHVAQIINESTAAVLACQIDEKTVNSIHNQILKENETTLILFMKSGGICSSFTVLEICNGIYSIKSKAGPFYIGGKDISDAIGRFIRTEFYGKYRLDPLENRRSMAKIKTAADNCKHILTTLSSTPIYIDSLMDGVDFNMQMSRARFDSLIQPVLNNFMSILNTALLDLNKENKQIDQIVLAGATLKIPKLQSMIETRFPKAVLHKKFATDEIVAIGCARQSLFLNKIEEQDLEPSKQLSFTVHDIYIWINNESDSTDKKKLLCKKGTILPNAFQIEFEENEIMSDLKNRDSHDATDINNLIKNYELTFRIGSLDKLCEVTCSSDTYQTGKFILRVEIELNENDLPIFKLKAI